MHGHRVRGRSFGAGSELLRMDLSMSTRAATRSRLVVMATGGLKAKGKRHFARDFSVKRILGEGSFGQVYEVNTRRWRDVLRSKSLGSDDDAYWAGTCHT